MPMFNRDDSGIESNYEEGIPFRAISVIEIDSTWFEEYDYEAYAHTKVARFAHTVCRVVSIFDPDILSSVTKAA
jgi:hypothetical protein